MSERTPRARMRRPMPAGNELTGLIKLIGRNGGAPALRRFALWCASRPGVHSAGQQALIDASDYVMRAPHAYRHLQEIRSGLANAARTAERGLQRGDPAAAAFLSIYAATHPDARLAAFESARVAHRWAELDEEVRGAKFPVAGGETRQQQISFALSLLTGIRAETT
jgi:hypothetical protein